jgi:predicted Fe-Mo cluster-binding NifX family protein
MVKIAIPSNGNGGLKELINPRFGRCPNFTLVTLENNVIKAVETINNNAVDAMGGAGIQAVELIASNGANEAIVNNLGPNAFQAFKSLNIKIYQAPNEVMPIKDCINLYIQGELKEIELPNVNAHSGMGLMGRGQGMRRGQGMGRGKGMGQGSRSRW